MTSLIGSAFEDKNFRWDKRSARHLLNRAGFGIPPSAIERLAALPPHEAVRSFVEYEKYPEPNAPPDWLPDPPDFRALRSQIREMTAEQRQQHRRKLQRAERDALVRLQGWWLERMCRTQRPLEEKMTLFWHGHFAVSAQKVRSARANYDLNAILRRHATGNFRTLVREVARSPAMLEYLDNRNNVRGNPNENWARELFELFTLGIGHYTENDIKEAARAFTGWTVRGAQSMFVPRRHDDGVKTIFGRSGRFDGDDVIELILAQPACAEFICAKLWRYFAYEDPEPEIIRGLAETFRHSSYELKPVLTQMFTSRAFYSERAIGTQIKSPAQYVAQLLVQVDVNLPPRPPLAQLAMRAMGQELFMPPNVKGWEGGRRWINTTTLLVRQNFATFLVGGGALPFQAPKLPVPLGSRDDRTSSAPFAAVRRDRAVQSSEEVSQMLANPPTMSEQGEGSAVSSDSHFIPAGQDAMASDIPVRTLNRALATPALRGRRLPPSVDIRKVFAKLDGATPEQIADALAMYFLGHPLDTVQRREVLQLLAPSRSPQHPIALADASEANLRATLQLILCTAEYQLC